VAIETRDINIGYHPLINGKLSISLLLFRLYLRTSHETMFWRNYVQISDANSVKVEEKRDVDLGYYPLVDVEEKRHRPWLPSSCRCRGEAGC